MAWWARGAMVKARLKEADVHGWMDGWDWAWMTFMMAFWLVILWLNGVRHRGLSRESSPKV